MMKENKENNFKYTTARTTLIKRTLSCFCNRLSSISPGARLKILVAFALLVTFQNCAQPYDLKVKPYVDPPGSLDNAVVINEGQKLTNNRVLNLSLDKKYAREVYLTKDATCASGGQWDSFQPKKEYMWESPDGEADIFVKFRNFSKEESPCLKATIVVDTTPPQLTFVEKADPVTKSKDANFKIDAIDEVSGVEKFECRLNTEGDEWKSCQKETVFKNLKDNHYKWQVRSKDVAGNTSEPVEHDWIVDGTAPALKIEIKPVRFTPMNGAELAFSATEAMIGTGVAVFNCQINGSTPAPCTSPVKLNNLANGDYNFVVSAVDAAGNQALASYLWTVDNAKPKVEIATKPEGLVNSRTNRVTFTGEDEKGSGVGGYLCKLNGEEKPCNGKSITYSNQPDGTYNFSVVSVDRATNISGGKGTSWKVDGTKPEIEMTKMPEKKTKSSGANFSYRITDDKGSGIDKVTCTIDGEETGCSKGGAYVGKLVAKKTHTFRVTALDKAGNSRTTSYSWYVEAP